MKIKNTGSWELYMRFYSLLRWETELGSTRIFKFHLEILNISNSLNFKNLKLTWQCKHTTPPFVHWRISPPLCLFHDYFQTLLHSQGSSWGKNVGGRHMCSPWCGIPALGRFQGFLVINFSPNHPKRSLVAALAPWNSPGKAEGGGLG